MNDLYQSAMAYIASLLHTYPTSSFIGLIVLVYIIPAIGVYFSILSLYRKRS